MVKKYVADLTGFRAQDARKPGAFLETASLLLPLAAHRLFPPRTPLPPIEKACAEPDTLPNMTTCRV